MTPASAAPPLTRRIKLAFAVGSTAESMVITAVTQFVLIFYNQVRGLPPHLVGLAFSAGIMLNAVCDPVIGSWSDRTRSRLGRRHPFMFASIVPVAAALYAVFNPPQGLGQTGELVWLTVFNIVLLQSLTLFHTPHLALGGELSENYLERSSVMNYNTFFLWGGDSLSWVLSFAWFFRPRPGFTDGKLDPAAYPAFSLTLAAVVVTLLGGCTLLTRSRIPYLPQPQAQTAAFSPRAFFRDVGHALSNRNYLWLVLGSLTYTLMSGVRGGLWIYTATYFWRLSNLQISWFVIGSLIGYVFAAQVVTRLHRRLDKRLTLVLAVAANTVLPAIPLVLGWLGWMGPHTPGLVPLLIGFGALGHLPYSLMTTTLNSAVADIADENELRYGDREEGVLFSTRTLFLKIDQALGTVLAGWVLTVIAFPAHARPETVPPGVLTALAAAFVLAGVGGVVAALCYARFGVTRDTYAATRAALLTRRGEPPSRAAEEALAGASA